MMEEQDTPEEEGEEEETRTHPMDGLYAEQIDDMTRKKVSHIRLRVGYIS